MTLLPTLGTILLLDVFGGSDCHAHPSGYTIHQPTFWETDIITLGTILSFLCCVLGESDFHPHPQGAQFTNT